LMFAAVAIIQIAAAVPLLRAPNVPVVERASGAFRAARMGIILSAIDGWFDACFIFVWQIALFLSLGESIAAYGGAMAIAGLAGAGLGLVMGRHIDMRGGRMTVIIAYGGMATIVLLRAASLGTPLFAVATNALGAFLGTLMLPASTAIYNAAKASPCPMRFLIATEGAWDTGCIASCLIAAALTSWGVSLAFVTLVAIAPLVVAARTLWRYYSLGGGSLTNA